MNLIVKTHEFVLMTGLKKNMRLDMHLNYLLCYRLVENCIVTFHARDTCLLQGNQLMR